LEAIRIKGSTIQFRCLAGEPVPEREVVFDVVNRSDKGEWMGAFTESASLCFRANQIGVQRAIVGRPRDDRISNDFCGNLESKIAGSLVGNILDSHAV